MRCDNSREHLRCRGSFSELSRLNAYVGRNVTYNVVPDSGHCRGPHLSVLEGNETVELSWVGPQLRIFPQCKARQTVEKRGPTTTPDDAAPCNLLQIYGGNVHLENFKLDNEDCALRSGLRGRMSLALMRLFGMRYTERLTFRSLHFQTANVSNFVSVYLAPFSNERQTSLDRVSFLNMSNGVVKCDACAGNITAENVPRIEVYRRRGASLNVSGHDFELFDVNSVVTDAILREATPVINAVPEASDDAVTVRVLWAIILAMIVAFFFETLSALIYVCRTTSVDRVDDDDDDVEESSM